MTLDRLAEGSTVFVDSTIFIYHFTGASEDCRRFLARCEHGQVKGVTSALVLAEVLHRLMTIEAVTRGLVSSGSVARKLRTKPDIVRELHVADQQVERIPLMGIDVIGVDLGCILRARDLRRRHGLMTNDSLVALAALESADSNIATADTDFERVTGLAVHHPADLRLQPA